ncbi:MAG: SusC/RagA family TonB-linked outer membrane protein [Tannerella sp.]|jgi:TonB-linked SusC/RagA family outer membrane protein|nr:SusC/RagA family TonB-linked outer membrane protein [Tannerella sp.]
MKRLLLKIVLPVGLLYASAVTAGDDVPVDTICLDLKNVTLETVLNAIEEQSGFLFFYDENELDMSKKIRVKAVNEPVSAVLDRVLNKRRISYIITGHHIVLFKTRSEKDRDRGVSLRQEISVEGTVTDENGDPLAGTTVVASSGNGTVSDMDGKYSITVHAEDKITFSYVGYITRTVAPKSMLEIMLVPAAIGLDEVVVIGYGTLEKKQVTNAITSISAGELTQGDGGATVMSAMKGKVNSLVIRETASPNASTTLQLRGMASVNASRAPLVVIDGMPGGDVRSVVLEDIQSIDILKDAAAGAIYGTRATGGVILIVTKKAEEGKMKLSYTGETMFKQAFGKPRVMNAKEFSYYKPGVMNYGYDIDWWDEGMNDNPLSSRHVITMQGGSHDARIYATVMYEDNRGVLMGDSRKGLGGRINGNFRLLNGWLDVNTHVHYRQAKRNHSTPDVAVLLAMNPTRSPYDPSQWDAQNGLDYPNTIIDAGLITNQGLEKWFRPDAELKLNILPVEGLAYHQTLGYENNQYEWQYYAPSTATVTEIQNRSGRGTAELQFSKTDLLNADGYFSFVRSFDGHLVNASAGYSYFEQNGEMFGMKNYGFAVDGVKMWDIGKGAYLNNPTISDPRAEMQSGKQITQRLLACFGRIHYSHKDAYIVSVTLRREGSSKFAVNKRWGNFWQVSGAWRLSNEGFMKNLSFVNDLKLRIAYGVTGNEGFSAEYADVTYSADSYWILPNNNWAYAYGITNNINPDLGWEEKHEWNAGLDFEFSNRRIYGKIDLYRRDVKGLIYEVIVPTPPYTDNKMFKNIGSLRNKGWEIELGADVYRNKDWAYDTKLNVSHNSTKVGSMWGEANYLLGEIEVGRAGSIHRLEENVQVGSFYLYKFAGFDEEGRFQAYDRNNRIIVPETDGKRLEDKRYTGNYMPNVVIGWIHDVRYKNWSLSTTLTSWIDFDIYNEIEHMMGTTGGVPGTGNQLLAAFTKNSHIKGQTLECDYFLEDATFLKIQNISLGYRFDTAKYFKLLASAKLYLSGNNLLTLTKYSGLNPETDLTGWEGGIERIAYPQTRTYTLGVQLNF